MTYKHLGSKFKNKSCGIGNVENISTSPQISSINPNVVDIFGSATISLIGRNFNNVINVMIGGTSCTNIVRLSSTEISVTCPAKSAGIYDVTVTTSNGVNTLINGYESWSIKDEPGFSAARLFQFDQGVTITGSVSLFIDNKLMMDPGISGTGSFTIARDGAGLISFNGNLFSLGGWSSTSAFSGSVATTNQIIKSSDSGRTWQEVLGHELNPAQTGPSARFRRRHSHGCVLHTYNNINYVYVIGGDHLDSNELYPADVWRSSDGCETWERVATGCPWGPRMLHMVASFNSKLYILGGQSDITNVATALRDVWESSDGGVNWTNLGNASWTARGAVIQPPVFDSKLWVIGGGTYHDVALSRSYYNDVYSWDGNTWTEVLSNSHGQWPAREYHNTLSYNSKLYINCGYNTISGNLSSSYYSSDGITWTEIANSPIAASHAIAATVHSGSIFMLGGIHSANADDFRVWKLQSFSGTNCFNVSDQGSTLKNLSQSVSNRQPLLIQNVLNGNNALWFDGVNDFIRLGAKDNADTDGWFFAAIVRTNKNSTEAALLVGQEVIGTIATTAYDQFGITAGQVVYYEGAQPGYTRAGSGLLDDQPRLIMASHKSDGSIKLYIGETQVGSGSFSYHATHTGWDAVGAGYSADGSTGDKFFKGFIAATIVIKGNPNLVTSAIRTKINKWSKKWVP